MLWGGQFWLAAGMGFQIEEIFFLRDLRCWERKSWLWSREWKQKVMMTCKGHKSTLTPGQSWRPLGWEETEEAALWLQQLVNPSIVTWDSQIRIPTYLFSGQIDLTPLESPQPHCVPSKAFSCRLTNLPATVNNTPKLPWSSFLVHCLVQAVQSVHPFTESQSLTNLKAVVLCSVTLD